MSEKLGEMGAALCSIHTAVKAATTLHQKIGELSKIIEETNKQANNIEDLQIPDEPLLVELKQASRKLRGSGPKLETLLLIFITETHAFEKFLRTKVPGSTIPTELLGEFCEILKRTAGFATHFNRAFNEFFDRLTDTQTVATKLTDKLRQNGTQIQEQASSVRNRGAAGTAVLVLAGVGFAALGFFTGGTTWVAAGVTAGTACGFGAVAAGRLTAGKVKELREPVSDILANANAMGVIVKNLKDSSDSADVIRLDAEAIEGLKTALEIFRNYNEDRKDQKIAELEAKLRSGEYNGEPKIADLGAKLQNDEDNGEQKITDLGPCCEMMKTIGNRRSQSCGPSREAWLTCET